MAYMCQYSNKECDACGRCCEYDRDPIHTCQECGSGIYEDEGYYDLGSFFYCEDCMSKHWHTA